MGDAANGFALLHARRSARRLGGREAGRSKPESVECKGRRDRTADKRPLAKAPGALPMPLQSIISRDAFSSIDRAAAAGNAKARDLVSYFVGQGVGLIDSVKSAGAVVQEFKEEFAEAVEHMNALVAE